MFLMLNMLNDFGAYLWEGAASKVPGVAWTCGLEMGFVACMHKHA